MSKLDPKYIFLPLFYHLFLSLGLLFLSIILIFPDGGIEVKQNIAYAKEDRVKTRVSEPRETTLAKREEVERNTVAKKIDTFFERHKTPLSGYGKVFAREAKKNEIDPTIVASIAWCESNGGRKTPQFGGKETYNAWGYAVFDNNSVTRQINGYDMGSWENGIEIMSRAIKKYYDKGLIEPDEIVTRYTPASVRKAGGDPKQAPWTFCVKTTQEKILAY